MTLSEYFTTRNYGERFRSRELAMSELGLSAKEWTNRKDRTIKELGPTWGFALRSLYQDLKPITEHGGTMVEQLAFAAVALGLQPYWGDGK